MTGVGFRGKVLGGTVVQPREGSGSEKGMELVIAGTGGGVSMMARGVSSRKLFVGSCDGTEKGSDGCSCCESISSTCSDSGESSTSVVVESDMVGGSL